MLAEDIESSITGIGNEHSSGYFKIFERQIGGIDCVGLVDVVAQRSENTYDVEYNVYSIANEVDGDNICEPEWDLIEGTKSALAKFLCQLVNVSFRPSELERLVANYLD